MGEQLDIPDDKAAAMVTATRNLALAIANRQAIEAELDRVKRDYSARIAEATEKITKCRLAHKAATSAFMSDVSAGRSS